MEDGRRGGMVVRVAGELRFVPAPVAICVAPPPRLTSVPGAPAELVGIAVHQGSVLPVLAVGQARGNMLVCQHAGELVGILGAEAISTGTFPVAPERSDLVIVDGERASPLDIASVYARIVTRARAGR